MMTMHYQNSRLVLAGLLAAMTTVGAVCAQDDGGPQPGPIEARVGIEQLKLERALARISRKESRKKLGDRFELSLKSRVEKLDRRYGLSEAQRKKLDLAGRADIDRYFERVEELEKKLALVRIDRVEQLTNLNEIATRAFQSRDLFDEQSFFFKVLGKTLTKEQAAEYQSLEREIVIERHRATLEWVLGTWDQTLGLSALQHQRLKALLNQVTRAPKKFGTDDYFGVLLQVSRLPEDKIKALFSADQWAKLQPEFTEAKRMEPTLKRGGYVPENDVADVPSSVGTPAAKSERKQG